MDAIGKLLGGLGQFVAGVAVASTFISGCVIYRRFVWSEKEMDSIFENRMMHIGRDAMSGKNLVTRDSHVNRLHPEEAARIKQFVLGGNFGHPLLVYGPHHTGKTTVIASALKEAAASPGPGRKVMTLRVDLNDNINIAALRFLAAAAAFSVDTAKMRQSEIVADVGLRRILLYNTPFVKSLLEMVANATSGTQIGNASRELVTPIDKVDPMELIDLAVTLFSNALQRMGDRAPLLVVWISDGQKLLAPDESGRVSVDNNSATALLRKWAHGRSTVAHPNFGLIFEVSDMFSAVETTCRPAGAFEEVYVGANGTVPKGATNMPKFKDDATRDGVRALVGRHAGDWHIVARMPNVESVDYNAIKNYVVEKVYKELDGALAHVFTFLGGNGARDVVTCLRSVRDGEWSKEFSVSELINDQVVMALVSNNVLMLDPRNHLVPQRPVLKEAIELYLQKQRA